MNKPRATLVSPGMKHLWMLLTVALVASACGDVNPNPLPPSAPTHPDVGVLTPIVQPTQPTPAPPHVVEPVPPVINPTPPPATIPPSQPRPPDPPLPPPPPPPPPGPPTLSLTMGCTANAHGTASTCNLSATYGGAPVSSANFTHLDVDYGDGHLDQYNNTPLISHVYANPGTYLLIVAANVSTVDGPRNGTTSQSLKVP